MISLFDGARNRTLILRVCFCIFIINVSGFGCESQAQVIQDSLQSRSASKQVRADSTRMRFIIDSVRSSRLIKNNTLAFSGDTLFRSPWGAVLRSLVVPGWGQWYNDHKLKAPVFLAADGAMMTIYIHKNKKVRRLERQRTEIDRQIKYDPFLSAAKKSILQGRFSDLTTNLDGALNDRNLYGWFFAISHLLGMVDAYVDAHLFSFKDKMDFAFDPSGGIYVSWTIKL
jgi:hypothetical protein